MEPAVGLYTPATTLNRVVFPEPFGPMMPTILSTSIEISTPAKAITPPNSLRSSVISKAAIRLLLSSRSFCQEPSINIQQTGADSSRQRQDDHEQADAIGNPGINRIELHDLGQEADDD